MRALAPIRETAVTQPRDASNRLVDITDAAVIEHDGADSHKPSATVAIAAALDATNRTIPSVPIQVQSVHRERVSTPDDQEHDNAVSTSAPGSSRRITLAEKLREIFSLEKPEPIIGEYQCWLLRTVLLQGFLYVTAGHLCFYAYLQGKEGLTTRSGSLSKRSSKTRLYYRLWFVLKDNVLSWYPSSKDPYFPIDQIDMHYVTSIDLSTSNPAQFSVRTSKKRYHFSCESQLSATEWVRVLKKTAFKAQNQGESVRIAIPLETIITIEAATDLGFAQNTIRVQVQDTESGDSSEMSEYYLTFSQDTKETVELIQSAVEDAKQSLQQLKDSDAPVSSIVDTTASTLSEIGKSSSTIIAKQKSVAVEDLFPSAAKSSRHAQASRSANQSFAQARPYDSDSDNEMDGDQSPSQSLLYSKHVYPPESTQPYGEIEQTTWGNTLSRGWGIQQWVKGKSRQVLTMPNKLHLAPVKPLSFRTVSEIVSMPSRFLSRESRRVQTGVVNREIVPDGEQGEDAEVRLFFSLGANESILARHHAYLYRGLPIYGQLYVTTAHVCFRSSGVVFKTKVCDAEAAIPHIA